MSHASNDYMPSADRAKGYFKKAIKDLYLTDKPAPIVDDDLDKYESADLIRMRKQYRSDLLVPEDGSTSANEKIRRAKLAADTKRSRLLSEKDTPPPADVYARNSDYVAGGKKNHAPEPKAGAFTITQS